MGAIGTALLAQRSGLEARFEFSVRSDEFETRGVDCGGCANMCELIIATRDGRLIDAWGNRCERGLVRAAAMVDGSQT
jgi:hypothetical protein